MDNAEALTSKMSEMTDKLESVIGHFTFAARVRRSPLSPTLMLRLSFSTSFCFVDYEMAESSLFHNGLGPSHSNVLSSHAAREHMHCTHQAKLSEGFFIRNISNSEN